MIYGIDTGFLVAAEVIEHPLHSAARIKLTTLTTGGDQFALAPQVLAEFVHIVTDGKRFGRPLSMIEAVDLAQRWWTAREVVAVFPGKDSVAHFFDWMRQYALGRKRLLDTLLAATFQEAGVSYVLTTNAADFSTFGCFHCVTP